MPQTLASELPARPAPRFYVTPRQRFNPGALVLAMVLALGGLAGVLYGLRHTQRAAGTGQLEFGSAGVASDASDDDADDPSRVDTIYLGGPNQAPSTTRPAAHPSTVHPFVVVHLPRSGEQFGQIPDTPAGHLLYTWLAAFNSTDLAAVAQALPTTDPGATRAAQLDLRKQTGGFTLLSAKEVQPGLLVFRLHDQTVAGNEALGTLQMREGSFPPSIASFSLRAVPTSQAPAPPRAQAQPVNPPPSH